MGDGCIDTHLDDGSREGTSLDGLLEGSRLGLKWVRIHSNLEHLQHQVQMRS